MICVRFLQAKTFNCSCGRVYM